MIIQEDISAVGYTTKPHGIKGELAVNFDRVSFDEDEVKFFILEMDGLFVPFCIEQFRFKTDTTALYKFEGIDTEEKARELSGKTIYIENKHLIEDDSEEGLSFFIGFEIFDKTAGSVGKITEVDESTQNHLFIVKNHGEELLIPATDYYITDVDEINKTIQMDLPEGLIDFDLAEEE